MDNQIPATDIPLENEINRQYPSIKQSWGIVGIAILSMLVFAVVEVSLSGFIGEEVAFLLYYLLSIGVVFWFAHEKRKKFTSISTYNFEFASGKIALLASITVVAMQIGIISPIVSLVPLPEFMKEIFRELAKRNGPFSFVTIVIAAPVLEEMIFRGIILDGLLKRYPPVTSILVSSVLFGIVHMNPWQFIGALGVGIFSGWMYYKTKMLTLSILIHAVNNFGAFCSMYFMDMEASLDMTLIESYGGLLNLIMITTGAIGVGAVCFYLLTLEINETETNYGKF